MTTFLEMTVHYTNGHTSTSHEEDSPVGRVRSEKAAFAEMSRDNVEWVGVTRVTRRANTRSKGRYR